MVLRHGASILAHELRMLSPTKCNRLRVGALTMRAVWGADSCQSDCRLLSLCCDRHSPTAQDDYAVNFRNQWSLVSFEYADHFKPHTICFDKQGLKLYGRLLGVRAIRCHHGPTFTVSCSRPEEARRG